MMIGRAFRILPPQAAGVVGEGKGAQFLPCPNP
jgi:hypothetical protein